MIGDLLLTWMSEIGKGPISDLRSRLMWLARTENLIAGEKAANRWLRSLSAHGHCEIDWRNDRWAIAPPAIVRLPAADGLAVLVGARRPRLLRALEDANAYLEPAARAGASQLISAPTTFLMPFQSENEVEEAAAAVGATYAGCAASTLASGLQPTAPTSPSAPPAFDAQLLVLADITSHDWKPAPALQDARPDGLYKERIQGRWKYRLRSNAAWFATDLAPGIYAELSRRDERVIRWRGDEGSVSRAGTVIIDKGAILPPLQERALVLCSGFDPRYGDSAKTALYENVPRELATQVAASLGQELQLAD